MLRKLALTAGIVTILGVAAFFAPHEAQAADLLRSLVMAA